MDVETKLKLERAYHQGFKRGMIVGVVLVLLVFGLGWILF